MTPASVCCGSHSPILHQPGPCSRTSQGLQQGADADNRRAPDGTMPPARGGSRLGDAQPCAAGGIVICALEYLASSRWAPATHAPDRYTVVRGFCCAWKHACSRAMTLSPARPMTGSGCCRRASSEGLVVSSCLDLRRVIHHTEDKKVIPGHTTSVILHPWWCAQVASVQEASATERPRLSAAALRTLLLVLRGCWGSPWTSGPPRHTGSTCPDAAHAGSHSNSGLRHTPCIYLLHSTSCLLV